jgi:hypothetical protein
MQLFYDEIFNWEFQRQGQSGRGLPHSKTLREVPMRSKVRQLLNAGGLLPVWGCRGRDSQCNRKVFDVAPGLN